MPVLALVDECPLYDLTPEKPAEAIYPASPRTLKAADDDLQAILPELLAAPNVASRRAVFEQYDWLVQSRTVRRPDEADAAVLLLPDGSAIAVAIDGSGRRVAADPYRGTVEAVFECAANLACVGAEPLGLTNCLNFGNPEKPHIAWQLSESVRGMADACRALDTPVVGGNVSLYNEGGGGPIYPTPVVGIVGKLPDAARAGRLGFALAGDAIAVVRAASPSLPGSELAKLRGEALPDGLPERNLPALRGAMELVRDAVRDGRIRSAHDVAEGGLAVALAEAALAGGLGAKIDLRKVGGHSCQSKPLDEQLYGEAPGTFVVSGPRELLAELRAPEGLHFAVKLVGEVGGDRVEVEHDGGTLSWSLDALRAARDHGLADALDETVRLDD
jgi:phosphoribosylformylglycinamidine synthase